MYTTTTGVGALVTAGAGAADTDAADDAETTMDGEVAVRLGAHQQCGLEKVGRSDFQEMLRRVVEGVVGGKGQLIVFAHHRLVMDELHKQLGAMGADRKKPKDDRFRVCRIDGTT
jgi:hypothetical protein